MAHLDTEFKKQQNPELQSLIASQVRSTGRWTGYQLMSSQFEGKQVYNTVCQHCHRRSERDSDFLEIELNIEVIHVSATRG